MQPGVQEIPMQLEMIQLLVNGIRGSPGSSVLRVDRKEYIMSCIMHYKADFHW